MLKCQRCVFFLQHRTFPVEKVCQTIFVWPAINQEHINFAKSIPFNPDTDCQEWPLCGSFCCILISAHSTASDGVSLHNTCRQWIKSCVVENLREAVLCKPFIHISSPQIPVHHWLVFKPWVLFRSCADPLSALQRSCFRWCALLRELPKAILLTKTVFVDIPLGCVPIIPVNRAAGIQMSSVFHVFSPTTPQWSRFGN